MNSNTNARIAGILFIVATAAGVASLPFSGITSDPDYLVKMAASANRVIVGALLQTVMALACAGIAIWLYPTLRKYDPALALGAVGFRLIESVLFAVSAAGLFALLALSREFVQAGAPDVAQFQTMGTLVRAASDGLATGPGAFAFCTGAMLYYVVFYRSKLIPRWLSIWGIAAIVLHLLSALLVTFGSDPFSAIPAALNLAIFVQEMVLAVWLIAKGFSASAIVSESAMQV